MQNISVPYAGENPIAGVIHQWKKGEGEHVSLGEVVVIIETPFALYELNGFEGVVRRIHMYTGQRVESGMVIGLIGSEGEHLPDDSIFSQLLPAPPPPLDWVAPQWLPFIARRSAEALFNVRPSAVMVIFVLFLVVLLMLLIKDFQQSRMNAPMLLWYSSMLLLVSGMIAINGRRVRREHRLDEK